MSFWLAGIDIWGMVVVSPEPSDLNRDTHTLACPSLHEVLNGHMAPMDVMLETNGQRLPC